MEFVMRLKWIAAIAFVGVVASGCDSSVMKPHSPPKAVVTEKWNNARADVLGSLAQEQYKGGNLDKARESVDNGLKLNPKNVQLRILSGKIALEQGNLDLAEKEFRLAQLQDVTSGEADYLCGVVYQRWQKPQVAYELYVSAVGKAPNELAYVLAAAEMLVDMNRSDDALNMLRAKADSFEHSAEIRDAIGLLLTGKGRYAEAISFLQQATMLATDDSTIHEHLAMARYFNKDYREAAELFAKLVSQEKYKQRVDLYLALGESDEQIGRLDDAKASFATATQVSPGTPEAWVRLGKVSLEKNDIRRAEMALRKASSLDVASGEANLLLGYIRLRQNKLDEAMPYFKKACALNQSDTVSLCMVGYVNEKAGRTDEAIQCYAKALKLHPGDELATKLMASIDAN